jgi:hypothetical protein
MEAWRNLKSLMHEKDKLAAKTVNMEARMESEVERHMEVFKGEIHGERCRDNGEAQRDIRERVLMA